MKEKHRILIVDGDEAARENWAGIVRKDPDFQVDQASSGKEALRKIRRVVPDIVLSALSVPDMEGLSLCRELKSDPDAPQANIYFILVGPAGTEGERVRHVEVGADDYLASPVRPDELLARVKVGQRIAIQLKRADLEYKRMFQEIDMLLVQDGGCAPGYNPVTAFITYHMEAQGRRVYATMEGFKSLASGKDTDFLRLVYDPVLFKKLDRHPGVYHAAPLSEWRGAQLRSERYKDFLKPEVQRKAAAIIKRKKVRGIIAIGGNGTFKGIRSLCEMIPTSIQTFFIPVTIDSDVAGTDCIGQFTGVEIGAEKIRCYMADARTHKRIYIVEMMGANSGFHALHSCLGARAHMAVLPNSVIDHRRVASALNRRDEAVIVVAEGYKKLEREARGIKDNAAEYFYKELVATGIKIRRRVVCEPFSRDIRGAAPNNMDISLAQRMAYNVASYMKAGTSRLMPAVQSGREYAIPFNEIETDNLKEKDLMVLADRLTSG
ncbi:MAG: 6-phosphofructokinase [Deltaproteobacteria bacterium]|nr:6-phosphofructokinase [Deltaproteobacteria bacterium]